jgi:hypothetical protein
MTVVARRAKERFIAKNATNSSQNAPAHPSIKDIPMASRTKQTSAFTTAKPPGGAWACLGFLELFFDSAEDEVSYSRSAKKWLATRNHHRFYYPNSKIRETNPFAQGRFPVKTFFRKTNPFAGRGQNPSDLRECSSHSG